MPIEKIVAAVGDLASLGLTVKADQIRQRLQLDKPQAGDEVVGGRAPTPEPPLPKPQLPIPTGAPTGLHARRLLGSLVTLQAAEAPEAVEALSDRLAEDAAGALAGLQDDIRAEFDAATDLRDLAERLSRLQLDPAAFAEAMARGMALAHIVGQADLLDELGGVTRHAALSDAERDQLPDNDFAVPAKRKLRIDDTKHVKLAWDMVDRTQGLTPAERRTARRRILARAAKLGIDTSGWEQGGA